MTTPDPRCPSAPPAASDTPATGRCARRESPRAPRRAQRFGGEFLLPAAEPATPLAARLRLNGWVVERRLAAGAQAELFLVRPAAADPALRDDRAFVAKVFRLQGASGARWSAEEQHWRMLRAVVALRLLEASPVSRIPRVVSFSTCLDGPGGERRPWYVMPYYAGGAMWQTGADGAGGRWAEPYRGQVDRVIEIAEALATTLAAMHDGRRRVVHRDVTPDNVLFAEPGGTPILADFGVALLDGFAEHPADAGWSNPSAWRPPELDAGDGYHAGPEGDVFMLGGLVYQALSGGRVLPPAREWGGGPPHARAAYTLRQDGDDPRVVAVEALLDRMLTRDPSRRLPAREVARFCRAIRSLPGASPCDPAAPASGAGTDS